LRLISNRRDSRFYRSTLLEAIALSPLIVRVSLLSTYVEGGYWIRRVAIACELLRPLVAYLLYLEARLVYRPLEASSFLFEAFVERV
jgi:hypothetical protein